MRISVRTSTLLYLAFLIFLVPLNWLFSWLFAIAFHEFCHYATVKAFGGEVFSLQIGVGGAEMQCSILPKTFAILSILVGPVLGCMPMLLARWLPELAVCCMALSVYNLLPFTPLDGGRALCLMVGDGIFASVQRVLLILALLFAIYGMVMWKLGIFPFLIIVNLYIKNRKSPCK